ncbi:protein SMG9-like [Coffea eugenioides]|nr:protein SMG9-like [Coffea eugenioides]
MAAPVFVQTKLRDKDVNPHNAAQLRKALQQCFNPSSFVRLKCQNASKENSISAIKSQNDGTDSAALKLFLVPSKNRDDSPWAQYESYISVIWKLRDEVLSMSGSSFSRTVSERDWLKNSAKIWDMIKNSAVIADYCKTLQSSGMFRR